MLNCGRVFEHYKRDIVTAALYYKMAAEKECSEAMIKLAKLLQKCEGEKEDIIYYVKKAVEYGDPEGMFMLGQIYEEGKYLEKNIDESKKFFQMAEENGFVND
ncbi:hypothetical protein TRFO_14664 [Tritrichomonas foetus]|uniref:Sel1 repeat family protein n=1 Tax=Tritrichomonas foetus TaxID=1144522 RepID=A0A1J4KUC5_9EUKA|nr:hypothetical protein TRFO_14664 [Tritrichomonas foetus]|eukprot:OHT14881.1 hypothetical protein TRFO_14664 [Tritrichomonas foetus]